MREHRAVVYIPEERWDRVNRLLSIGSFYGKTDAELQEQGAKTNQNERIFSVTFDDGSSLNFDLCSGRLNYWDDVVWTSADGSRGIAFGSDFELGDIEFEIEREPYYVKVIRGCGAETEPLAVEEDIL